MSRASSAGDVEDPALRRPVSVVGFEEVVRNPPDPPEQSRHPVIVQLLPGEFPRFSTFCRRRRIRLIDEFERQARDLAQVRLPAGTDADRQWLVTGLFERNGDPRACGTWVFLPWERMAAHILSPDDYFEVVTNRNREKIDAAEQRLLRTKTVGVMGSRWVGKPPRRWPRNISAAVSSWPTSTGWTCRI